MDLVVAAEANDFVIAACCEYPVVSLGAGDLIIAVRTGNDKIGVVEVVGC